MAALNETPRQKMMGILYLVLLGLAATTVTDHVLDAFRNLTVSLETSTKNVQNTVDNTFKSFEATNLKNDAVRAKPIYDRAVLVKKYAAELDAYILELKNELISKGGGIVPESGDVKDRADVDLSPRIMIKGQHKASELKKRIEDTKSKIIATLVEREREGLQLALNATDPPKRGGIKTSWEETNFGDGIPLTAAITALTKIQADLKNTESDVVKKILGEANETKLIMDRFEAIAVPSSSYVLVGQQYKAEVFLTASSTTSNPEIVIGGQKLNVVDGKGLYTVTATAEGERKWGGIIRIVQTDGKVKEYALKEQSYMVAKPSAVVSPDKMNVFYIGVPNPVSISAPGIPKEKLRVSLSAGEISGSNGQYVVNVKAGTPKVTVTVSGELEKGKSVVLGSNEFRVKRIPNPKVKFANKTTGKLPAVVMKATDRIFAMMEEFDFEAKFTINHFTLFINRPRADLFTRESNSNVFTPEMVSGMSSLVPGTRVTFDFIFATGPDGVRRSLDPITFTVE